MRTRLAVLATILSALVAVMAPGIANAAPRHNHGLTINATPNPIIAGEGVLIYGQLNGQDSANQTIYLYHRIVPALHFSIISVTKTNAQGFYEFTRAEGIVETNRNWFVRGPDGSHSRTIHERVSSLVTLSANPTQTVTGTPVVLTGSVSPVHVSQLVKIQEQDSVTGNGWVTIAKGYTNAASAFAVQHAWRLPGTYTLRALFPADPRNIAGESDSETVTVQQKQNPSFTINTSSPIISDGQSATISGTLDQPATTTPEASTQVTLYGKTSGEPLEALQTTTTGTDGSYSFQVMPINNTVYKVKTTLQPHQVTASLYEGVQDVVTIASSSPTAQVGGSVTIRGVVTPDHTGHVIYLQRLDALGNWQNVANGVVTTGSNYSFSYTFGQAGPYQLRARIYGGPENVGGASSPETVTVSGVEPVTSLPPAS
jgi:hypothetical protein